MTVEQQFAANLLRCRKAAGLSQEQLAFRAELHRTEIGMVERGARMVRLDTLLKLAGALGVEPSNLLAGMAWKPGDRDRGRFAGRYPDVDG